MKACFCVNGPGPGGCNACGAPGWRNPAPPSFLPPSRSLSEDDVRRIVREEIAYHEKYRFDPMRQIG